MIYVKITNDIKTATKALPNLEGICFILNRDKDEVHIVTQDRYQPLIEKFLSVEIILPFTEDIRLKLINLDNALYVGDPKLIQ